MATIYIINGPNLNLLGKREPEIYGKTSFDDFFKEKLQTQFFEVELFSFQSNHEGEIIDKIHEVGFDIDAIIINAGALTHTSVAIADALKAVPCDAIEVHISNVHQREDFRHKSYLSPVCKGVIAGFGLQSYTLAVEALTKD